MSKYRGFTAISLLFLIAACTSESSSEISTPSSTTTTIPTPTTAASSSTAAAPPPTTASASTSTAVSASSSAAPAKPTEESVAVTFRDPYGWSWRVEVQGRRFIRARKVIENSPPGRAAVQLDLIPFEASLTNMDKGRTPPSNVAYEIGVAFDSPMPNFNFQQQFHTCYGNGYVACGIGSVGESSITEPGPGFQHVDSGDPSSFTMEEADEADVDAHVKVLNSPATWLLIYPYGQPGCSLAYEYDKKTWVIRANSSEGCEILS